jgi:predicted ATP-grasp superfamily ATP-dependent carboligase
MYTGKLENHPRVLHQLAARHPLWGNDADTVQALADPAQLEKALAALGLPFAAWRSSPQGVPTDGSWLVRTHRGVRRWYGQSLASTAIYWQQYLEGQPTSAAYLADGQRCLWLGASWQLVGQPWCSAREFQWCGNVGPMPCSFALREKLRRLGTGLTQHFRLRGVFGVDFILQGDTPWVTEINPRYPASLEVLELSQPCPWFAAHVAAFTQGHLPGNLCGGEELNKLGCTTPPAAQTQPGTKPTRFTGKAILFSPKAVRFQAEPLAEIGPILSPDLSQFDLALADVPETGAFIAARAPLLTVLTQGRSPTECWQQLQTAAQRIYRSLNHVAPL